MNKQSIRALGLLLLLAVVLVPAARAQERKPTPGHHHSLWQVNGRSNVVYLLGSIHLLKPTDYPLAAPIERAFTHSRIVVFETDLGKLQEPAMQLKLLSKSSLPAGETLKEQLSHDIYADFTNHAHAEGLSPVMFESLKPSMAAVTLEVFALIKLGLNPEYGVDQHFFRLARKAGKQIVPLETVDFQINLATDFSRQEGEQVLKSTLDEIDQTRKLFGEMVTAWKTGNAEDLARLLNHAKKESPTIYRRLVTDRNRQWIPKIEKLLRGSENAMVIVGAGHLVGKDGVVALLEKAGYHVTQQ